jgi:hypothetical protein
MGIFARVLEKILAARQDRQPSLLGGQGARTDPTWYPLRRLAIPPEVISRLKKAAESEEKHATLNPMYLTYLIEDLGLTDEEQRQLRAALLAQGVEMFLQDRMADEEPDAVIEITEFVYDNLLEQFKDAQSGGILGRTRNADVFDAADRTMVVETALTLADRVGDLVAAAKAAQKRHAPAEEQFWRHLAITGYQQIIQLLRPVDLALAASFEETLTRFQAP